MHRLRSILRVASPLVVLAALFALPSIVASGRMLAVPTDTETATATRTPTSTPTPTPTTEVLISEFRSRGPYSNAPEFDEFVELFNQTGAPKDMGNWQIRSKACGSPIDVAVFTFPGGFMLGSHQHYLIGGNGYSGNVPVDGTILPAVAELVADTGGLALVDGGSNIIDQVGTCDTAPAFGEGSRLAPLSGLANQSYDRRMITGGSCADSGNNASDFVRRIPADPQNSNSTVLTCGNPLPPTPTATPYFNPPLVISEVGWGGTTNDAADQWIELYNRSDSAVTLSNGWVLRSATATAFSVPLAGTVEPGHYFLLVHASNAAASRTPDPDATNACVAFRLSDPANRYDQLFTGSFSRSFGELQLMYPQLSLPADRTGLLAGSWPAGAMTPVARSMERHDTSQPATPSNWYTYAGAPPGGLFDCRGNKVYGSPKRGNWARSVTATPSPTPTSTPYSKYRLPTPVPTPRVVINEVLPRAGTDWNHDGRVDTGDEFIEIINMGPVDADLTGWTLDTDLAETIFDFPERTLRPGERAVFYGSETELRLLDSGATVRLTNDSGDVVDARTYSAVTEADLSVCRLPDGSTKREGCFPTPGRLNSMTGMLPFPAIVASNQAACLISDTIPDAFRAGECAPYGSQIWNPQYWLGFAGTEYFLMPDALSRWQTILH